MIDLTTNITISPNDYTHLQVVKMEVDLRSGVGTFYYAPVQITSDLIHLGEETRMDGGAVKYLYPEIVHNVTLQQNLQQQDAVIAAVWNALLPFFDEVDPITEDSLTGQVVQIGVTEWSLAGAYASVGSRVLAHKLIDNRSPLDIAIIGMLTIDPTIEIT